MATRATYSFKHRFAKKDIVFYVHWDNFPEGAAEYFWEMHQHKHLKGGLAEVFIKANPLSVEFTRSHEYHADTEYRYHMDKDGFLAAEQIDRNASKFCKFDIFFTGHYAEFINEYNEGANHLYQLDAETVYPYSTKQVEYMTLNEVQNKVEKLCRDVCVSGYKQYKDDLERWTKELRRINDLHRQGVCKKE